MKKKNSKERSGIFYRLFQFSTSWSSWVKSCWLKSLSFFADILRRWGGGLSRLRFSCFFDLYVRPWLHLWPKLPICELKMKMGMIPNDFWKQQLFPLCRLGRILETPNTFFSKFQNVVQVVILNIFWRDRV